MNDDRRKIDLERYLRTKVKILNDSGVKGFDRGVRTFKCPLCRDDKGRGWWNVALWTAGCFNVGCVAHERLEGGALEWARRVEGKRTRGEMFGDLRKVYGTERVIEYKPIPREGDDFVRWPAGMRLFKADDRSPQQRTFELFATKQWGITLADMVTWGLGYCTSGYYAQRVIIPIVMGEQPVAFQARTIGVDPKKKYITSRHGPKEEPTSECARAASEILFNYDRIQKGGRVVLVEGVGDVMGWHRGNLDRQPTAAAMLGVSLTPEKLALLEALDLEDITLAVDAEPDAQAQACRLLEDMRDWSLSANLATWRGGKDAGSGADLAPVPTGFPEMVRACLARS